MSNFKASSYGDCIEHTRAAKAFADSTGLAETLVLKGTPHPSVANQDVEDTYALLLRDVTTDSWWFWKASPKTCEPVSNMAVLPAAYPPDEWTPSITSTIILQMDRHDKRFCALHLVTPPSFLSTVASGVASLPLVSTASSVFSRIMQVFAPAPRTPTILTRTSSCVYSFSIIDELPEPSTDVKVEWLDKKVTFILTINAPTFKLSQPPDQRWDNDNPPTITIDRLEGKVKTTYPLRIVQDQQQPLIHRLEPTGQGSPVTHPTVQVPKDTPYVPNAPPEFTALMWLCYSPMAPNDLPQCISSWWKNELQK